MVIIIIDQGGIIMVSLIDDMNVQRCVQEIDYGYGSSYTNISDSGLIKHTREDNQYILPAIGDCSHTLLIKVANGEVYRITIEVRSCVETNILIYDNRIGVFTNGFDIMSTAYAKGTYTDWDDMYETAYYVGMNTWLPISEFALGELYTFYFKPLQGTEYFRTLVVNESLMT